VAISQLTLKEHESLAGLGSAEGARRHVAPWRADLLAHARAGISRILNGRYDKEKPENSRPVLD
jgi:hypothetical protein